MHKIFFYPSRNQFIYFSPKADDMIFTALSNTWQSSPSNCHFLPLFRPLKLTFHTSLCQAYPGAPLVSRSPPNRPRFSTDYTCSRASDNYSQPASHGLVFSNLDSYSVRCGFSSRAQSMSSMATLEELRACEIDSEGGSETPSPTHCQLSNMAIDIPTARTANVTIPQGLDLWTALSFCLTVFFLFYIFQSGP